MGKSEETSVRQETFCRLKELRAGAIEHYRLALQLHTERRDIMRGLIEEGVSQAEIARELGVTRQAIQKMLAENVASIPAPLIVRKRRKNAQTIARTDH
jgi:DNA invertase Pin-like site-specific DNA recombinase